MARITNKSDLNHGTEYTVDTGALTLQLSVAGNLSAGSANGVDGQPLYSELQDYWKSAAGLNAYQFPFRMVDGPIATMLELREGWTFADATSISLLRNCGFAYKDTSSVVQEEYACFVQLGTVNDAADQPYYLIDGTVPVNFGVADEFNECIQIYDNGVLDYRATSVSQFFVREAGDTYGGYDMQASQGFSTLEPRAYFIPITTATDPNIVTSSPSGSPYSGMTLTLGATTNTIGGTSYDFAEGEIEANSGTVQQVYDWFQDLLLSTSDIDSGAGTQRGNTYLDGSLSFAGGVLTTSQGLTIKNIAAADASNIIHVDDTGTNRQEPQTNNAEVTGMPTTGANIRLQIYNVTTATEIYNADPGGATYSASYTEGVTYTAGDSVRIRFAEMDGGTTFKTYTNTVVASSTGWTTACDEVADSVYATNAEDGSAITKFSADFTDDEIDLSTSTNFTAAEAYAFYCYTLTTSQGIDGFWGGVDAIDAGNYRINSSVLNLVFDNLGSTHHWQTDTARIYRDDGARPVKNPCTGAGGIDLNWLNQVYTVSTGSVLTAGQATSLANAESFAETAKNKATELHEESGLDASNPVTMTVVADRYASKAANAWTIANTDNGDGTETLQRS